MIYARKDKVVFKSTKSKDPNVKWIRKVGTIIEITYIDNKPCYNVHVEDGTIETVLATAVESKA